MPPKVKSALAPEPMPTQPEDTQSVTESEKERPTKKKKKSVKANAKASKKSRKRRPSKVALVKNAIAQKMLVHPQQVQQFLEALDSVALEFLKTKNMFRLNFLTVRLRTIPAREASQVRRFGKDIFVKALPERRTLRLTASNSLKQLCK